MGKGYSRDLRERVVIAWEEGEGTPEELAVRFRVGRATVHRWLKLWRETGDVEHRELGGGVRSQFDEEGLPKLLELLEERPDSTLEELCEAWFARYGTKTSPSSLVRAFKRAGVTRKKRH